MSFIAGPYTGTYNVGGSALSIGQIQDGFAMDLSHFYEQITGDNFAETVQELITRGNDAFLAFTMLEADAAAMPEIIWPNNVSAFGTVGQVGRIVTAAIGAGAALARATIFTRVAGTTADFTTVTASSSIIAPNARVAMEHAPRLKRVPIRLMCLPNSSGVLFAVA